MAESLRPLRVLDVVDGKVVLQGYRSTVCGHCACSVPGAGGSVWEIRVDADESVQPGDEIRLQIPAREFLAGVASLYGLPLAFLFAGVAVGLWLGPHLGWSGSSAGLQVISAGSGLLLSLPVLRFLDRKLASRPGYRPRLILTAKVRQDLLGLKAAEIGDEDSCDGLEVGDD